MFWKNLNYVNIDECQLKNKIPEDKFSTNILMFYLQHRKLNDCTNILMFYLKHRKLFSCANILMFYLQHRKLNNWAVKWIFMKFNNVEQFKNLKL